jgi:transposase-like protein
MIRNSFTSAQKLKIIAAAKSTGVSVTALHINIHKSMIYRWIKMEENIKSSKKSTRKIGSGRTPSFPEAENDVNDYILNLRKESISVCYDMIKSKMSSLCPSFKASNGWLYGFLKRYTLGLRICTTTVRKRSGDVSAAVSLKEDKIRSFHQFFERSTADWRSSGMDYDIWNMDETPVWMDMPPKTTVDVKGKKRIVQITTGSEKKRITAVLCCSSNGMKSEPLLVQSQLKAVHLDNVVYQENGYMNSDLTVHWIENCFLPSLRSSRNILVFDSFTGHLTDDVLNCLKENNIRYAVIPGGCTSSLQPLDLTVNRSFKSKLRKHWRDWISSNDLDTTRSGYSRAAPLQDLKEWIKTSWQCIKMKVIQNGFRKAKIVAHSIR